MENNVNIIINKMKIIKKHLKTILSKVDVVVQKNKKVAVLAVEKNVNVLNRLAVVKATVVKANL
jgi:hypothetical protein